ncbi:DUF5017 domain-containing protein [Bacteroides sp. f07]|uniref:DUF5017 domain-containing protein n=1 Tax=Bacteroides sp. f07 TaxID=3132704 RepID=UPI0034BAC36C
MKTYKLIGTCIASLFFAACNDGLDEEVGLNIKVTTNENVSFDGQIITAKKGSPIEFTLSGDPDFLTFFSGEAGCKYQYRERETIDPSQIKSSTLNFSIWFQYGNPSTMIEKHVYISDEFTGLYKDNYEADSLLVEQFEKDGKWKEVIPQSEYPVASVGNADLATSYSYDMSEYMGKRMAIAICYRGIENTAAQSKMYFERMHITNVMNNGQEADFSAGSFGFTPINMKNKWNLKDQTSMKNEREYGTVTNNTAGIWNLTGIGAGSFFIHSTDAGNPLKYSWLVSDLITVNSCSPDQGTKIKDITQRLDTYTYTYNEIGIYNVTFLARNANIDHSSTTTYHMVVNVVE